METQMQDKIHTEGEVSQSYLGYIMARPGSNHHRVQGIVSPAQEVSDLGHSKFVPTRVV